MGAAVPTFKIPHKELGHVWADPSTFATTLLVMFIDLNLSEPDPEQDQEGMSFLTWEPATIQMEIEQHYGIDLPAINFEKLQNALALVNTNSFFVSLTDFMRACVAFNGHLPQENEMIFASAEELAWGVTEGLLLMPPEDNQENPFTPEITGYIGKRLDEEGILNPPDILRIATREQDLVDRVNYDYSDDPEMFSAIQGMEAGKTDSINFVIKGRLRALINQLKTLPLKVGQPAQMAEKLLANLPGEEDLPLPV
jgi:hypothetical protein